LALFGKSDGKIRVVCAGCGRKVKFPASELGKTFRCPACGAMVITSTGQKRGTAGGPGTGPGPAAAAGRRTSRSWRSAGLLVSKNAALEKLSVLFQKEEERTVQRAAEILSAGGTETERTRRLERLRSEKSERIRRIMERAASDLRTEIASLTRQAARSPAVQREFAAKNRELGELEIFGRAMFGLSPGWTQSATASGLPADRAQRGAGPRER